MNKNSCPDCNKEISKQAKFCASCAKKGLRNPMHGIISPNKGKIGKDSTNWKGGLPKCIDCGKEVTDRQYSRCRKCCNEYYIGNKHHAFIQGKPHCSKCEKELSDYQYKLCRECYLIFMKIPENNPNYVNGLSNEPYPIEFNEILKESIRKRDNYTCQNPDCSMTEEEHLIIIGRFLHIHHVDYDKTNCQKNNLITLCNQCNIRANYNRDYWMEFYKNILCKIKE
jgi:hypothetical protein